MNKLQILDQTVESTPAEEFALKARGVQNPRVVDLISHDKENNRVILSMIEERPWKNPSILARDLEEKINSYSAYVLDGFLAQQYPQYAELPVCFRYESAFEISDEIRSRMAVIENFCNSHSIEFQITCQS